jgi:hypothetical protein
MAYKPVSSKQLKKRAEAERRSLDIIRVHNVTAQDRAVKWNMAISGQKWVVPAYKKDVGYGKGNQDLPRFVAEKFLKELMEHIINVKWKKWWEEYKKEFNKGEYIHKYEQQQAITVNNYKGREVWQKYADKIWLGVVKEHGKDTYEEPQEDIIHQKGIREDILDSIGDKIYKKKAKLMGEISDETKKEI